LHRHLVERKRSASSASCYYLAYEDVGLLMLTAITEASKIREAGSDAWGVITDLCERGMAAGELQKVKNKLRLHQAMQTEDALSLAELLSYYESYDSYQKIEEHVNRLQSLTADEIVQVARKYLRVENLSVMEYLNDSLPEFTAFEYQAHLLNDVAPPEKITEAPFVLAPQEPLPEQTSPTPIVTQGRATYIFQPESQYPFIAAGIFFLGGRNEESEANAGITHLLHRSALKGTSKLNAEELAFRLDALGNPPRFNCYRDFSGFTMEAMPEAFPELWSLLIHCIVDSQFPAEEIETEKGKVLSAIKRNMDDNFIRPVQLFHRAFYGSHPYGLPETGFEQTVPLIGQEQLHHWKKQLWNCKRTIISIVGSFDPEKMYGQIEKSLIDLQSSGQDVVPPAFNHSSGKIEVEERPKKQTAFVLGFPAPSAASTENPTYDVLQQVLSGMGGRLFLNLRSKKALAYTVHAATISGLYGGAFVTYIAGDAAKEQLAIEGMWEELEKLKNHSVELEEVHNARSALIGNYGLNTQTAAARVLDYVNCFILNRPLPYAPEYRELLSIVNEDEIQRIAQKMFHRDNSTIGIVRGTTVQTEAEKMIAAT
jgi:zinc protease